MSKTELDVASYLGWPFTPGQFVKVKPGEGWRGDWDNTVLRVSGVRVRPSGGFEVTADEVTPYTGATDFDADDLEPARDPKKDAPEYVLHADIESVRTSAVMTNTAPMITTMLELGNGLTLTSSLPVQPAVITTSMVMVEEKPLTEADKAVHSALARLHRRD